MRKVFLFILIILIPVLASALTAKEIIDRVDQNRIGENQYYKGKMVITKRNRKLIKTFEGYSKDSEDTFYMKFTNPEDKGVKYLKIDDQLWIYFPDADDVMKISGSMLRQGMMGSDLSYEDMIRMDSIEEKYNTKLLGEKEFNGEKCYEVELTAKDDAEDVTYYREVMLVHKEKFVMVQVDLFAKSGRLLKRMENTKIEEIDGKFVGTKVVIKDMKKKDTETVMEFTEFDFNVELPEGVFTRNYLFR